MPLSGNNNKGLYNEDNNVTPGKGKKKIIVNSGISTEQLRTDLNMQWDEARYEQGAFSLINDVNLLDETMAYNYPDNPPSVGTNKCLPDSNSPNFCGPVQIQVRDKDYLLTFRETKESDLFASPAGGQGNVTGLGRVEEFIFYVPGESIGYMQWDGVYDSANIRHIFKNILHFQFVLGGIDYNKFTSHHLYNTFSDDERELFSSMREPEGGDGQMLPALYEKIHHDHFIELETPYTKKEVELLNSSIRILEGDISTTFNFDSPKYQELASEEGHYRLSETQLPNFYSYLSEYDSMQDSLALGGKGPKGKAGVKSDYTLGGHYDQLTLGGLISYDSIPFFITKPGAQKLSMIDLVSLQQNQASFLQLDDIKSQIQELSEYSNAYTKGAPYFEQYAAAFIDMENSDTYNPDLYGEDAPQADYLETKAFFIHQYNKSIVFSRKNMKYVRDFNDKIDMFPFHVKLEIPNGTNSLFSKYLEELDMESEFLNMVTTYAEFDMVGNENFEDEMVSSLSFTEGVHNVVKPTFEEFKYDEKFDLKNESIFRTYNIDIFMSRLQSGLSAVPGGNAASLDQARNYVGPGGFQVVSEKIKQKEAQALTFQSVLKTTLFKSKLQNLLKKNFRSYKDLLIGKPAYKEIVGYRVAKHTVAGDGVVSEKPIQNIFFMNKEDIHSIIYYDTQVKYNRKYKYIVHAYVFVVGNSYTFADKNNRVAPDVVTDFYGSAVTEADTKFVRVVPPDPALNQDILDTLGVKADDLDEFGGEGKWASGTGEFSWQDQFYAAKAFYKTLKVYNMISPMIIEIPYFEFNDEYEHQLVMDNPPLHPQVTFTPYREINNKLLITLETTLGNYSAKPVNILPSDEDYYSLARLSQNKTGEEPIEFNAEDSNKEYQVFRIGPDAAGNTPMPHSYSDFEKHLYMTMNTFTSLLAFDDILERNRTYYYIFRAIDRRKGISNPSPVYKAELVGDPDYNLSYPRVTVHNFEENQNKKMKKSFRRYLHINPSLEQITVDGEASGFDAMDSADSWDAPVVGVAKESMVGSEQAVTGHQKRFKIRLTSKATGRKIDFNVRFVHRHVKNV